MCTILPSTVEVISATSFTEDTSRMLMRSFEVEDEIVLVLVLLVTRSTGEVLQKPRTIIQTSEHTQLNTLVDISE